MSGRSLLARGLLPSFANFADNFLVRAVHYRFASTTGAGLQAADAFLYETFHLKKAMAGHLSETRLQLQAFGVLNMIDLTLPISVSLKFMRQRSQIYMI